MIKKSWCFELILVAIFFVYVFQLPLVRFSTIYILDILFIIYLVLKLRVFVVNKIICKVFYGFVPFLLYFILVMTCKNIIGGGSAYSGNIKNFILAFIHIIIVMLFLGVLMDGKNLTTENVIRILITVTAIQLFCVALAFIFPSIKTFFNSFTIENSRASTVVAATVKFTNRAYGFADNLFDQFGYIISLLTTITFAYALHKKSRILMVLSITFLFMPLLNARTGLLLSLVGLVITLLVYFRTASLFSVLKWICAIVIFIFIFKEVFNSLPSTTQTWIQTGINEMYLFLFQQESTGTLNQLFGIDVVFPDDILFGAGGTPLDFGVAGVDNGYIRMIWMFGLIGTILLLLGYANMFVQSYKASTNSLGRSVSVAFGVIFAIYSVKLFPLYMPGANMLLFGIPFIIIKYGDILEDSSGRSDFSNT